jgi:DNA-binding MarR family transcriptional regulator
LVVRTTKMAADDILAPCACFRARSMARAITVLYDETLDDSGLRTHQLAILAAIRSHGAVSMQVLAAELGVDPSTMTRTLLPMEREGFVASEPGEDRRVRELALTPKGHRKLAEAGRLWAKAQKTLREKLGSERFERLLADMAEVLTVLKDDTSEQTASPSQ